MNRLAGILVGLSVGAVAGCGSSKLSAPSGSGGSAGDGGAAGAAGAAGGAGRQSPAGRDGGAVDRPVAIDGAAGHPNIAWDATFCTSGQPEQPPWIWSVTLAGSGSDAGGTPDTGTSGCRNRSAVVGAGPSDVSCGGAAWLRNAGGSPTLTWDDGSSLAWVDPGMAMPPPLPRGQADRRIWAALARRTIALPSGCGSSQIQTVELRDTANGNLLFVAQQGLGAPEPTKAQLDLLFGVETTSGVECQTSLEALDGSNQIRQQFLYHQVWGAPSGAQVIPAEGVTQVTAPNGAFAVHWFSRLAAAPTSGQLDCSTDIATTSFIASRISSGGPRDAGGGPTAPDPWYHGGSYVTAIDVKFCPGKPNCGTCQTTVDVDPFAPPAFSSVLFPGLLLCSIPARDAGAPAVAALPAYVRPAQVAQRIGPIACPNVYPSGAELKVDMISPDRSPYGGDTAANCRFVPPLPGDFPVSGSCETGVASSTCVSDCSACPAQ